jgi:predicted nucleic-acid-binding protein
MTGLDTNLIVRYFVKNDPAQTALVLNLIHSLTPSNPGWIGQATILELFWVLTRIYRIDKAGILRILGTLLSSKDLTIENDHAIRIAVEVYREGNADFTDCLIAASGRAAGCSRTVTLDRVAARDAGMELLA